MNKELIYDGLSRAMQATELALLDNVNWRNLWETITRLDNLLVTS